MIARPAAPPTRRLILAGRQAAGEIVLAVALGLGGAMLAVAQAWLLAAVIDRAFMGGAALADVAGELLALVAAMALRPLAAWGGEVAAQRISATVKARLRDDLLSAVVGLGPRSPSLPASGELAVLATRGLDALDGFFGRYLPQLALAAFVPLLVVICLAAVDGIAAATVALTVPLIPVFMVLVGRLSAEQRARRWTVLERLARRFADVVAGLPTLRAFGAADAQAAVLGRTTEHYRAATMAMLRVAFLSALVLELLATISVAMVAVGIGLRLADGDLPFRIGLFALIIAPEAYLPLRRLGAEFHASEEGVTAAVRAYAILDAQAAVAGAAAPPRPPAWLAIDRVSVLQPGRDIVAPVEATLRVAPGEVVAVVGPSGVGKSTLLLAVLGLVRPDQGRVLVGGPSGEALAVPDLDPEAWASLVAWAPQEPFLLPGSLAANVRFGAREAIDDARVEAALIAVGLAGRGWPGREVGEAGRGLSGGERRRVGVARALAREAAVLLLDEPTAGLDPDAERRVLAAIRASAERGAMVIVAAHRPAAIAGADRVVSIGWAAAADPARRGAP